jgi:hypothetical protein
MTSCGQVFLFEIDARWAAGVELFSVVARRRGIRPELNRNWPAKRYPTDLWAATLRAHVGRAEEVQGWASLALLAGTGCWSSAR